MPQNFLFPQRDQPLLLPVDMREWLPGDDLVFVVLDAVATLDLGGFRRRYRAGGHGRAAFDPEMMVALLLYGSCQGERSGRCRRPGRSWLRRPPPTPPTMPGTAAARSRPRRGRWHGGLSGGSGWPGPGTGWRPGTRRAARRSGRSRRPGTRLRRPGNAAGPPSWR